LLQFRECSFLQFGLDPGWVAPKRRCNIEHSTVAPPCWIPNSVLRLIPMRSALLMYRISLFLEDGFQGISV
jgi:hypothetical protein